ncbi:MAG: hypothetical protein MJZ35_06150 [Bacteroidaceae bacterium]|nr:hypothetical protein [Bacteroidaceae bacterium]
MKKLFVLAMGAMMLMACGGKQGMSESELAAQREIDSLKAVNANQAKELEDFMDMAAQVEEGFRLIKEAEGRVDIKDGNVETSQKELVAENMQFIQQQMQQNRELINQLKNKLSKSSANLSSLQKHLDMLEAEMKTQTARIQELQAQLAERDQVIAEQGEKIEQLSEDVSTLTTENEQKTAEVAAQDKELNTAWFVFGTRSELKEQKILDSGDVLKNSSFNKGYFTQIDIRYDKDIRFYSKSAKLLTSHPSGSYQLVKDAKGEYELHITNPQQFWSVSKYLVVQVK